MESQYIKTIMMHLADKSDFMLSDHETRAVNPVELVKSVKSVQSALSDLKRPPERLQSQCNYRPFFT